MFGWLAHRITASPWKVIAGALLVSTLFLAGLKHIHFVSDFDSTLPNRSELTQQILENHERFGGKNMLAFLVEGGTPDDRVAASCTLSQALETMPGVTPGHVYGVGSNSLSMVSSKAEGVIVDGLSTLCGRKGALADLTGDRLGPQKPLILAPSGDLVVSADLSLTSGEFGPLLSRIDAAVATIKYPGVSIHYSGQPAFLAQNDLFSKRVAKFFPFIMLLVLLLHWEALRSMQAVVVPIFTGLSATLLALGAYSWLGLPLDTYTVLAPILVLAVGAGHSVQLLKRYMEELRQRVPAGTQASAEANVAAIHATIEAMGPVLTLAVIGAATCLFALLVLDVAALARFGLLAGIGVIAALVLELTVVPAIRTLLRRPVVSPKYGELSAWWQQRLDKLCEAALTWPVKKIGILLGIILVFLVGGVAQVRSSHSMSVYTASDVPVQATLARLRSAGVGPYSLDVVIDSGKSGGAFEPALTEKAIKLADTLSKDADVRAVLSAPAVIGFVRCRFSGEPGCDAQATGSADEAQQTWTVLLGNMQDAGMMDADARYLRLRAFVQSDETHSTSRLIATAKGFAQQEHLAITVGGSAVAAKALADGIVRVSLEKAALLASIVFLMGGLVFRSFKMAFLFLIPALATIAANFAYLGWSGTSLNVATAAVATIAVGISLDYLIYLSFRIREAQAGGLDYLSSIRTGHASAGGAAVCVAVAVAVGYAILIFSPGYLVHHWIAVLVPTTMLMSLFGALFVFPFLLRLTRPSLLSASVQKDNMQCAPMMSN